MQRLSLEMEHAKITTTSQSSSAYETLLEGHFQCVEGFPHNTRFWVFASVSKSIANGANNGENAESFN